MKSSIDKFNISFEKSDAKSGILQDYWGGKRGFDLLF